MEEEGSEVPAGMRLMSEEERLQTLAVLNESTTLTKIEPGFRFFCIFVFLRVDAFQLEQQLQAMPLTVETVGQRRRMKELTDKMDEIEQAKKVFNKPKGALKIIVAQSVSFCEE